MLKDTFVLTKNSWHVKLMKFTLNMNYDDFTHICPYFWLTILNIFIVLPVIFIRTVISVVMYLGRKLDEIEKAKQDKFIQRLLVDPKLRERFAARCKLYSKYRKLLYNVIYEKDSSLFRKIVNLRSALAEEEESKIQQKERLNEDKRRARKERITSLVLKTKAVARVVITVCSIVVILLLLHGVYKLFLLSKGYVIDWQQVLAYTISIIILAVVVYIGILLHKLFKYTMKRFNISNGFTKGLNSFFSGIGSIFLIIYHIFKDNCPAIVWQDDQKVK